MLLYRKIVLLFFIIFGALNFAAGQGFFDFNIRFSDNNIDLKENIHYNRQLSSKNEAESELKDVYSQLHDLGYLEVIKDSCQYDSTEITCYLTSGKKYKYYVSQLNIGEEVKVQIFQGKTYNKQGLAPAEYRKLTDEILYYFQNNGYPFARVSLGNIQIKGDSITGSINIDNSHHIVFDTLQLNGNVNINQRFLAMHTGVKPDRDYSESVVENLENRLNVLDFVSLTGTPEVIFTNTHAKVNIDLENRRANRFDGIAGMVYDEQAKNSMRLTGQLNLFLINTLERGEWIEMKWQGLGYGSQTLDLSAAYPYLFYTPFSAQMQFSMRKQDSTYIQVKRRPELEYRFENNLRANVFMDWRTSELMEVGMYGNLTELPDIIDYKTIFYGIGLNYTSDLFRVDPRRGADYSVNVAVGNRDIKRNSSLPGHLYDNIEFQSNQYTGQILLQRIFPFLDRSALMLKGEGGLVFGDDVFDNELYRIGGINSLRGFDEESIMASAYGIIMAEYRYVVGRNTYLSLFANGAFVERDSYSGYHTDIPVGLGAGLSQELPAGRLSLFFANGKRQDEPLDMSRIKVHVGFVSMF